MNRRVWSSSFALATRPMRSFATIALVLAVGCNYDGFREVQRCPEGTAMPPGNSGMCVPLPDGSLDAGLDAGDSGGPGPCGTCPTGRPFCNADARRCAACRDHDDCGGTTPRCDTMTGNCVECLSHDECEQPGEPACIAGRCEPCTDDAQCDGNTPACDVDTGRCVQCTASNRLACGPTACRPDHTCSAHLAGGQQACQPCDTDLNCQIGQLCVELSYGNPPPARSVGSFCQWRRDAMGVGAPGGTCGLTSQPYAQSTSARSVDGTSAIICTLATTTCPALFQHRTAVPGCDAAGQDSACGASGFNDGRCRENGAGEPLCTYPCLGTEDCRAGSTCPVAGDQFCSI